MYDATREEFVRGCANCGESKLVGAVRLSAAEWTEWYRAYWIGSGKTEVKRAV